MRRRRKKFHSHALTFVHRFTQVDHAAFLFFQRQWVSNHQHFARVNLVLQE